MDEEWEQLSLFGFLKMSNYNHHWRTLSLSLAASIPHGTITPLLSRVSSKKKTIAGRHAPSHACTHSTERPRKRGRGKSKKQEEEERSRERKKGGGISSPLSSFFVQKDTQPSVRNRYPHHLTTIEPPRGHCSR